MVFDAILLFILGKPMELIFKNLSLLLGRHNLKLALLDGIVDALLARKFINRHFCLLCSLLGWRGFWAHLEEVGQQVLTRVNLILEWMTRKFLELLFLPEALLLILALLSLFLDTSELFLSLLFLSEPPFALFLLLLPFNLKLSLPLVPFEHLHLLLLQPVDVAQEQLLELKVNH